VQSTEGISREIPHERFDRVMTVGRTFRAEKVAGQRNESCAGLLFPPEQGVNCTHFAQISSGIFLNCSLQLRDGRARRRHLARPDGVDFDEICAERRRGGHTADDQDLVACLCEPARQDGGLCLLDQAFEIAR